MSQRLAFLSRLKSGRRAERMAEIAVSLREAMEAELDAARLGGWKRQHAGAALAGGLITAVGLRAIRTASEQDLLARFDESYWRRLRSALPGESRSALVAEIGQARQIYLGHIGGSGGTLDADGLAQAIVWHLSSSLLSAAEGDPCAGPLRPVAEAAAYRCAQAYQYFHFHLN
jgi:hypothetical protein